MIRLRSLRALVFRASVETPVTTSFGTMRDRPCVLVRAEDEEGAAGWGEIWCNFPTVGAEHRARLVETVLAPLLERRAVRGPPEAFDTMTDATAVLALQSGEPGPVAQCIAGVDVALWDLVARRTGTPLWRLLGGSRPDVPVYASGLNPENGVRVALARQAEGYRAFKIKLGFGRARDLGNLAAVRAALGDAAVLMADVNQGWDLEEALAVAPSLAAARLDWLEEPLRADRPWAEWRRLAERMPTALAAGENVAGEAAFAEAIEAGALGVLQPDCGKWGGITGTLPVALRARAAGLRYCPHWLGGGVGLLASAHLLAAAGGSGRLEIDANPNPLRATLSGPIGTVRDGVVSLSEQPGLGIEPDLDALSAFRVAHR